MKRTIVGVMGPGRIATATQCTVANRMGALIGRVGYLLLTGGVEHGVMEAASRGAHGVHGQVIGVLPHKLPSDTHPMSSYVTIPIQTTFGEGRNVINALSSDVVVAIGMCPGTAMEVACAVKAKKPVIFLEQDVQTVHFFRNVLQGNVEVVTHPEDAMAIIDRLFPL